MCATRVTTVFGIWIVVAHICISTLGRERQENQKARVILSYTSSLSYLRLS